MTKGESLLLRISEEDKATIVAAAAKLGKSASRFTIEAALKEARALERHSPTRRAVHGGVPTYFKAMCMEAAAGGANNYSNVGYHLAAGLGDEQPWDVEEDEWEKELDALDALIASKDDERAWRWFQDHMPKFMALVPARRRDQFLAGVRQAYDEGIIAV